MVRPCRRILIKSVANSDQDLYESIIPVETVAHKTDISRFIQAFTNFPTLIPFNTRFEFLLINNITRSRWEKDRFNGFESIEFFQGRKGAQL